MRALPDRPPVAVIERDGDPEGAFAVAVTTEGVAEERGPEAAVALAAVAEARLSARGQAAPTTVAAAWDGYRVRALVADATQAQTLVSGVREALLAPIARDAPEVAAAQRKLDALAKRPLPDVALLPAARCRSDVFASPGSGQERPRLTAEALEAWRASAMRRGTVAIAAVGSRDIVEAVVGAIARGPAWPGAAAVPALRAPPPGANVTVYDASADLPPRTARVTLVLPTGAAADAVATATRAGDPRGALAARLLTLEAPAKLEDVTATAHPSGGCITVTLSLAPRDLASDGTARIAMAAALATRELSAELGEVVSEAAPAASAAGLGIAERAGDPREAADRAAWWTLVSPQRNPGHASTAPVSVAVGIARGPGAPSSDADFAGRAAALRAALERAQGASKEPVVELRSRVERGQGELWLLFGSPCGTLAEVDADAGLGATVAFAAAERAKELPGAEGVQTEAWATVDGIGVMAHATARSGESPASLAKRVGDCAAQSFSAEPLDADVVGRARAALLARATHSQDAQSFATLAGVLAPGHPSWLSPLGTGEALGRSSDAGVMARAAALRAGPLRVAVLANADAEQESAVLSAVDRWVARRPDEARTCPSPTQASPARPGTYAVEVPGAAAGQAWVAVALPPNDAAIRTRATVLAAALDGPDGLLARALGSGVAQSWGARVVGPSHAPALVLRLVAPEGALDAAVTQTKALLEALRQGSLAETDRVRAVEALAAADLAARLDPRGRLAALFRGDPAEPWSVRAPALDALRAFAATSLRSDALVIVAARPPRNGKGS